jgi:hypothetical protein
LGVLHFLALLWKKVHYGTEARLTLHEKSIDF